MLRFNCVFCTCGRSAGSQCCVCFRAELNRQKQRSHELEVQLETAHKTIAEVRLTNTHYFTLNTGNVTVKLKMGSGDRRYIYDIYPAL